MATASKKVVTEAGPAFTISREKLLEALAAVAPTIPSKTTLPVLGSFLVSVGDVGVTIAGTDLDIAITATAVADVDECGSFTVPAKPLLAIAKELPPAPVRIRAGRNAQLSLECGRTKIRLATLPADEFPALPSIEYNRGTIQASELATMVKRTAFAASREESRPILNGALWQRSGTTVRMVATNGHRLAYLERSMPAQLGADTDLIVPPKALEQIGRLFSADEEVEVGFGVNHLGFRSLTASVSTRLIEGPYPNYDQVMPKKHTREVVVDRMALLNAVKRCAPIATGDEHGIVLTIANGMIRISVTTPDLGEASDEIAAKITGSELRIGLNATYLLQVLNAVGTDEVILQATEPERPVVFRPVGEEPATSALFLIMPRRVIKA